MTATTMQLLKRIEAYLRRTGMSESAFSHAVQKNGILLRRLREGKGLHSKTVDRIDAILRAPVKRSRREG